MIVKKWDMQDTNTDKTAVQRKIKKLVLELQKQTDELSGSIQSATREQARSEDMNKVVVIKKQIGS
jgi:hypothetical protein